MKELHDVTAMALRDVAYEVGPFVTLVDAALFECWWEERNALLLGQIAGADLVALSRIDRLDAPGLEAMRKTLAPHADGLVPLCVPRGDGVDRIAEAIERPVRGRPPG